ncbi:hypothetical protein [Actinoplanes sp. ATCC 53533]|uniref:hypothetical protein n=1 Tax=Actinoplanes sp. ATCC 53533 TaxID=1288362 RepID=UPI000F778A0C|nr:hypothetical protein [Actinoplanes sp. ATCC 53533]
MTLTESQIRLLIAMTVTVNAQIRRGFAWAGNGKHRLPDLFALRAAGLVCSAEVGRDGWSVRRWQLSEKGRAEAQRISEQACSTDADMPTPRPRDARDDARA